MNPTGSQQAPVRWSLFWRCFNVDVIDYVAYDKRPEKRRRKNMVPLVAVKRKRALTLPLEEPGLGSMIGRSQKTYAQDQSTFFNKLPLELRMMVYERYFGDNYFIALYNGILRCNIDTHGHRAYAVSLLRSCRKVYSESISLLYNKPTFHFNDLDTFLSFYSIILPSRSASILSVSIDFTGTQLRPPYRDLNAVKSLNYREVQSQYQVHNHMPSLPWQQKPTFLDLGILLLQRMPGLKHLNLNIDKRFCSNNGFWSTEADVLAWFKPLKDRNIDIDICYSGDLNGVWRWRYREQKAFWQPIGGEVLAWKEGDGSEWTALLPV